MYIILIFNNILRKQVFLKIIQSIYIILEVYNDSDYYDFIIYKKSEHLTNEEALENAKNYKEYSKLNRYIIN